MRDVGTGAVTGQEHTFEIRKISGPPKHGPGIIVGGGERVLGRAAVVDGDDGDVGSGDEGVEVVVVCGGGGALDAEAAAVEVDEQGEVGVGVEVAGGEVETDGEASGVVDEEVFGGDAGGVVGGGWQDFGAEDALDAAALVDADEGGEVLVDLVVWIFRH